MVFYHCHCIYIRTISLLSQNLQKVGVDGAFYLMTGGVKNTEILIMKITQMLLGIRENASSAT